MDRLRWVSFLCFVSVSQFLYAGTAIVVPTVPKNSSTPSMPDTPSPTTATSGIPGCKPGSANDLSKETPVGQVIWSKGKMSAKLAAGTSRDLQRHSPVFAKDVISTDDAGSGQIVFTDSSALVLREKSELKIAEYKFKKDGPAQEDKSVMSLVKGGFRTVTGSIPKMNPDGYQVNTPVATIGVRGTDYSTSYNNESKEMAMKIDKGIVEVQNASGKVRLNKLSDDLYAVIHLNKPPELSRTEPAALKGQPGVKPVSASDVKAISTSNTPAAEGAAGGNSSGGGAAPAEAGTGGAGGGGTVNSFCIG